MNGYRINRFRLTVAAAFFMEIGLYFGMGHLFDHSPDEVIATGIAFLLFSLAAAKA